MSFSLHMGFVCDPSDSLMIPLSGLFMGEADPNPAKAQGQGWVEEGPPADCLVPARSLHGSWRASQGLG